MRSSSRSGRRGTRTPKRLAPPPVFKTGSSSGRMPSVSPRKLRGLESNQRPPGSEPGVTTNSNYPGSFQSRDTLRPEEVRGEGLEPSPPASRAGRLPLADPRECHDHRCAAVPGVEPASPADQPSVSARTWSLCRSAKGTFSIKAEGEGVEPSRP